MGHAESGTAEVYRIGELAAEAELSRDTLRYYERLGVIAQPRRSRGGFRLYGRDALEQIRFVKQAQSLGLALGEIRTLLSFSGTRAVARCRQVNRSSGPGCERSRCGWPTCARFVVPSTSR